MSKLLKVGLLCVTSANFGELPLRTAWNISGFKIWTSNLQVDEIGCLLSLGKFQFETWKLKPKWLTIYWCSVLWLIGSLLSFSLRQHQLSSTLDSIRPVRLENFELNFNQHFREREVWNSHYGLMNRTVYGERIDWNSIILVANEDGELLVMLNSLREKFSLWKRELIRMSNNS